MIADTPSITFYSIKWEVIAPLKKDPKKGYKEKGPTDVIQAELSKLSYIHGVGELHIGDLGDNKKHINIQHPLATFTVTGKFTTAGFLCLKHILC